MNRKFDSAALDRIAQYLREQGIADLERDTNPVIARSRGKTFSFSAHLRALVYALLSSQRRWSEIAPKLPEVDALFFDYDPEKIREKDAAYFEQGIRELRCGNRNIAGQVRSLAGNICVLERIQAEYGSLDAFVTSEPAEEIAGLLSKPGSRYKLRGVGTALAWEYLRNVGIDGAKPDTHLRRFFGSERIGISEHKEAGEEEVRREVERLAGEGRYNRFETDYLIWAYCADGMGEICTKNPHCERCIIRECCSLPGKENKT